MSKKSLIDNLQAALASEQDIHLSKDKVRGILDTLGGVVKDQIDIHGEVKLDGIAKLRVRDVAERTFSSMNGPQKVVKPAHRAVKARALVSLAA